MNKKYINIIIRFCLASVWLINGFYCKILNKINRHELIVARILGKEYSFYLTKAIGIAEVILSIWILLGFKKKTCAVFQIVCILTMNIIEFFLAKDLLLFGGYNFILAVLLCLIIYLNEFMLTTK